jgi:Holliday junction resolvasome RuvABC endonuclease subunit
VIIVGLDTSTYVGMARSNGVDDFVGKLIHFDGMDGWLRVQSIAQAVGQTLDNWKPNRAVIENYAVGMKTSPNTIILQVSIGTVVRAALYNRGIPWLEVRPSTLKKWTTGKGDAKKPDMALAAKEKWGFNSPSDDVVDGFALAQMGHYLLGLDKLPVGVKYGFGNF